MRVIVYKHYKVNLAI